MRITEVLLPLFIFSIISFIVGKTIYTYTMDIKWLYFNYALFACIFIIFMLLKLDLYIWFIIASLITILCITLFLIYKINIKDFFTDLEKSNRLFKNLKENLTNTSLFFWILLTISFITFIGILMAYKIKNKMQEKEGIIGDRGYRGARGDKGALSEIVNSNNEIIYIQLLDHAEVHLHKYKDKHNPPIEYKEGEKHLKNLQFKEHLKRISYSRELKRDIFNLNKKINPKGDCKNENRILQNTINNLKSELEEDILDNILLYKNGLRFLDDTFGMTSDWDHLYTKTDELAELPRNPYRLLAEKSIKWNYGGICK